MAQPTDAQLAERGITREEYDLKNALWHKLLREGDPDVRERINAEPNGIDAMTLATTVEIMLTQMKATAEKEGVKLSAESIRAATRARQELSPFGKIRESFRGPGK